MSDPSTSASQEERALFECLAGLKRTTSPRQAAHIRLSRLKDYYRRDYHMIIVAHCLDAALGSYLQARFRLFNGDMIVLLEHGGLDKLDGLLDTLGKLFGDDLLFADGAEAAAEPLCTRFELMEDFQKLVEAGRALALARKEHDSSCGASNLPRRGTADQEVLDASELAALKRAIRTADLSSMMIRQPVCAFADSAPPEIAFRELFVSIADLAHAVLPERNILGNRWLFQDLTRMLDARVLAHLAREDIAGDSEPFSLNLNIQTVLTPAFLKFDRALDNAGRGKMIVELQLFDVIADMNLFFFARDFLRTRGYRLCLDGLDHLSLRAVNRRQLGFDLVKLNWSPQMSDVLADSRDRALPDAIEAAGAEQTVLARCESEQALRDGRSLGIAFFQGFYVDRLLSGKARPTPARPQASAGKTTAAAAASPAPSRA